jgi:hypothetical protein
MKLILALFITIFFTWSCKTDAPKPAIVETQKQPAPPTVPVFEGKQAFSYLTAQTDFGPRNPGSAGHRNCLNYLQSEMQKYADAVNTQPFTVAGYNNETLKLTNVISSFNLQASTRILLIAHWDTRPRADQEKDPKKQNQLILGANDAASGIAVLMEIARHLKTTPPSVGVDMLFVDGEDYGKESDNTYYLLGAKYFAKNLPPGFSPAFGILLDMVGDKQLEIPKDRYSLDYAPDIVDLIWSTARELNVPQFVGTTSQGWITDDHLPLNQAGIKTIDLIDFNYPDATNRYWHTTQDTPDKCSPESLEAIGKVLLHVIYRYK